MKHTYLFYVLVACLLSPAMAFASGHTVSITVNYNVLCNGTNTGSATASVSGGVGPFSYAWSPAGGTNPT